jgi:putative membrane protein
MDKQNKKIKTKLKNIVKFTDDYNNEERIILRDHLAMERTKLANERTLLSYLRSSLYLILGGFGLISLKDSSLEDVKFLGYIALVFSIIFLVIGIVRYIQLKRHLRTFK